MARIQYTKITFNAPHPTIRVKRATLHDLYPEMTYFAIVTIVGGALGLLNIPYFSAFMFGLAGLSAFALITSGVPQFICFLGYKMDEQGHNARVNKAIKKYNNENK